MLIDRNHDLRRVGWAFVIAAVIIGVPQVVVATPWQFIILVAIVIAIVGGVLIVDHPKSEDKR